MPETRGRNNSSNNLKKNNLKNNLKKSQQQRKSGEDSSVGKQTKLLLSVLSNSAKIPHLSLLSTPDVIYIADEPSKKTEETDEN